MPTPNLDTDFDASSVSQIVDLFIKNNKLMNYMLANLDNKNIVNVAGFQATATVFKSKNGMVGMSSADPGDPNAIRFWAGSTDPSTAPFRVLEDGSIYSTEGFIGGWDIGPTMLSGTGIIQGGTIRTDAPGNERIEISGNSLKSYNSLDDLSGPVWGTITGSQFTDLFLYGSGLPLLKFYDDFNTIRITPTSQSTGVVIGDATANNKPVSAVGIWNFSGSVNLGSNVAQGTVQNAQHAASADSSSVANSIDWPNVTNHPNPTTLPLQDGGAAIGSSGLYAYSDHRHPTDTSRQATITGAATTITTSNLTASRALSSDVSGKVAVSAVTSTEQGYLSGVTSSIQTQLNTKATVLSGGSKIQSGSGTTVLSSAGSSVSTSVTFSTSFSSPPIVVASPTGASAAQNVYINVIAGNATTNGFTLSATSGSAQTIPWSWIAIGS